MKRSLIALLLVTVVVAGAAFGIARWLRCRACAEPKKFSLVRELNLTGTQAAEVAKLEAEYERQLGDICGKHCAARAELADSLNDRAKAEDSCGRMCAAQTDSEKLALDHLFKIRALLTPEQQQQHTELMRRQLTSACPMRLHRQ